MERKNLKSKKTDRKEFEIDVDLNIVFEEIEEITNSNYINFDDEIKNREVILSDKKIEDAFKEAYFDVYSL